MAGAETQYVVALAVDTVLFASGAYTATAVLVLALQLEVLANRL